MDDRGARTREESVALGRLLTALEAEMPPGEFSTHVLEVLHMPARDAQHFMAQYRASQGAESRPAPEASRGSRSDTGGRLPHLLPVTLGHLVGGAVMGAAVYWRTQA